VKTPSGVRRKFDEHLRVARMRYPEASRLTLLWAAWFEWQDEYVMREINREEKREDAEDVLFLDYMDRTYGRLNDTTQ